MTSQDLTTAAAVVPALPAATPAALSPDRHPAAVYLASLAHGPGRASMRSTLAHVAAMWGRTHRILPVAVATLRPCRRAAVPPRRTLRPEHHKQVLDQPRASRVSASMPVVSRAIAGCARRPRAPRRRPPARPPRRPPRERWRAGALRDAGDCAAPPAPGRAVRAARHPIFHRAGGPDGPAGRIRGLTGASAAARGAGDHSARRRAQGRGCCSGATGAGRGFRPPRGGEGRRAPASPSRRPLPLP